MSDIPIAAVVMAAGLGTRMRSAVPKHLHPVLGRRMVDWVLHAASDVGADPIVVVAAPQTSGDFGGFEVAVQEVPRGTGDAVRAARAAREGRAEHVLVLSGDAVHFKSNWDNRGVPSGNTDKDQTLASMQRIADVMAKENAQLWINHDKAQRDSLKMAPAYYD